MDSEHQQQGTPGRDQTWIRGDLTRRVPIPDHELIRCIGHGSYGAVWLARNMMGVFRAIKIVFRDSFPDPRPFQRELSGIRRFEPISRSHEGFIDVLHVGINDSDGYFYYVMELGDDEGEAGPVDPQVYVPKTLSREISFRRRLPVRDCLKLGLALTEALAELHRHGLVHRDIKPSNVIFVNGVPKLADIGLVADANEARSYVGTEGFIPPEGPGSPGADIYSLGKVLYEASTGRDRQDFPELPTNWDDPHEHAQLVELNEIVLQACKAEAKERYASARAMHAHLLVLENGQSVRRLRDLERLFANLKRLAGVTALVVVLGAAVFYHFYREHRFRLEAHQRQLGADVAYGSRAVESADYMGAVRYFTDALGLEQGDSARAANHRLRIGSVLAQSPRIVQMPFANGEITKLISSNDGAKLLFAERGGMAQMLDSKTGQPLTGRFGHKATLLAAALSPDNALVATGSEDRTCQMFRASDGVCVLSLPHPSAVSCVGFSPDGRFVATGCWDGKVRIWELATSNVVATFQRHTDLVSAVAFSRDGRRVVSAGHDRCAWVWDPASEQVLFGPLRHLRWLHDACFSPDGNNVVIACEDNKAHVWDLSGSAPREVLPTLDHEDRVFSAQYSPDGRWILTGSLDRTARLWLADTHRPLTPNSVLHHSDRVVSAGFAPDGHRILTGCTDGTGRVWDLAATVVAPDPFPGLFSEDFQRFLILTNGLAQLCDSGTGRPLAEAFRFDRREAVLTLDHYLISVLQVTTAPVRTTIEIWDPTAGRLAGPILTLTNLVSSWAVNAAGQLCILSGTNARLWEVSKGVPISPWLTHPGPGRSAFFSPDGQCLAVRGPRWVKLWDVNRGSELFPPLQEEFDLSCAAFSPDGSMLVTCAQEGDFAWISAHVWDARTGTQIAQLNHRDGILSASFSPDSKHIATASEDFTAIIWDARTGRQVGRPLRHLDQVTSVQFSEDGKWVLTASADMTARLWEGETGDPLTAPLPHLVRLARASFLPGNRRLVTQDNTGKFYSWAITPEQSSLTDITSLSRLLSGDIMVSNRLSQAGGESLQGLWSRLNSSHPSKFNVSPDQIAAWHDFAAKDCESHHQSQAASFHLECLQALRPNDAAVSNRLFLARTSQVAGK